ncbi:MAG: hypothetical protein K6T75_05440 [Acetobacteraceae bacterium]|nr:hypothetical protein [Acetobacteraceae bacterium]
MVGYTLKTVMPECVPDATTVNAVVELAADISELLPYLNAAVKGCVYNPDAPYLRFFKDSRAITLHPRKITITRVQDRQEAVQVMNWLAQLIDDTEANRHRMRPSYRRGTEVTALEIYRLLPRSNCRRCGEATCLAFASKAASGELDARTCPALQEPDGRESLMRLDEMLRRVGC